jgi:hypothetical protein
LGNKAAPVEIFCVLPNGLMKDFCGKIC